MRLQIINNNNYDKRKKKTNVIRSNIGNFQKTVNIQSNVDVRNLTIAIYNNISIVGVRRRDLVRQWRAQVVAAWRDKHRIGAVLFFFSTVKKRVGQTLLSIITMTRVGSTVIYILYDDNMACIP